MRLVLATAFATILAGSAMAQSQQRSTATVKDANGRTVERIERQGDRTVIKSPEGRTLERIERRGNVDIVTDPNGRTLRRIEHR